MSRRTAVPVTALALLVVGVLLFWFAWALSSQRGSTAQAQGTEDCPNAQIIDEFEGTGSQRTETFDTTGPFLITYDLTSTGDANPTLSIAVSAEEGGSVDNASQTGEGTGDLLVDEPPGAYYLNITTSGDANYIVTVERCEGGSPDTNTGQPKDQPKSEPQVQSKTEPKDQPKTQPTPQPQPTPPPQPDQGTLMKASGPSGGPVPKMPDGRCPKEFPVEKGGACYR